MTVRTETGSGPLFRRRLPVCGWVGGGKSRLRGVETELHGGLVGVLSEACQQVADLLLAVGDDTTRYGLVDGGTDVAAQLLELPTQAVDEIIGGDLRLLVHRAPGSKEGWPGLPGAPYQTMTPRFFCQTLGPRPAPRQNERVGRPRGPTLTP